MTIEELIEEYEQQSLENGEEIYYYSQYVYGK